MEIKLDALPPEPKRRLTADEYNFIYGNKETGRVPRVCVDLLVVKDKKLLIAMRDIEPFKNVWTLPGGGIAFGESIDEAAERIAKAELGVSITSKKLIGAIEHYPDGPYKHSISLAYVIEYKGEIQPDEQASEVQFFNEVPENTQPFQKKFLQEHWQEII